MISRNTLITRMYFEMSVCLSLFLQRH